MTLRARLAVVLTVTVLLPLLAVGAVVAILGPRLVAQTSSERLHVTAAAASSVLTDRCTALGLSARALALEVAPRLAAAEQPSADAPRAALGGLEDGSAAVLDAAGRVLASAGPADLGGAGGTSCSDPEAGGTDAARQVESVPIRTSDGELVGWAVAALPLTDQALEAVRQRAGLPAALLLVEDGEVVAAAREETGVGEEQQAAVSAAVGGPGGAGSGETDGVRYVVRAPPPGTSAVLVAAAPASTATFAKVALLVLGLAGLLAVGGTVAVARRLTAPLRELTDTVLRLADGDLSTRTGIRGQDEVGRLGAAVNTLADALQGSLEEVDAGRDAAAGNLERFSEALARTHDLDGLLHTVAEATATEAGADTCAVFVGNGPSLLQRAVADLEVHSPATAPRLLDAARAAVESRREVTDDETPGLHLVALPLRHGDHVLGAVVLAARRPLGRDAIASARSLARPAGTAVSNVLVHEETSRLSLTDPLTGLANFRSLSATLAREIERAARFGRPLAVLMLDVDHFKTVNDTWGHAVGDIVLRGLAARLLDVVREVDTVARYGGEEFVVVLPETDRRGGSEVAQRIVDAVRRDPFGGDGLNEPRRVTVSVGVAAYPEDGEDAAALMRVADDALYQAKRAGRDGWATSGANAGNALSG